MAGRIGEPIEPMVQRVRTWVSRGKTVKIMTARVSAPHMCPGDSAALEDARYWTKLIQDWLEQHGLLRLEVTCVKDYGMIELWDDRAVQVEMNTGRRIGPHPPASNEPA